MAGLSTFAGAAFLLPTLGGLWLDGQFHSGPWLTIVGFALGAAMSAGAVYTMVRRYLL
jgi:hypothetical protein